MSFPPSRIVPVLHVADLDRAVYFYIDVLGFTESFRYGGTYAAVHSGTVQLHLALGRGMHGGAVGGSSAYLFLDSAADVDAYYADITTRGARIDAPPRNYPYGMRDFVVRDPDGNILTIGAEMAESDG